MPNPFYSETKLPADGKKYGNSHNTQFLCYETHLTSQVVHGLAR